MARIRVELPMNRVEGDLELAVAIEDGVVVDAWSTGTMYRGFERILVGRGAMDGLVITPRICGLCSTSHLTAAARALDVIAAVPPPPDAQRVRNVCLAAEHLQSDIRQAILMYCVDFANVAHAGHSMYDEAVRRYEALKGSAAVEVVRETRKPLEIIAIFGGQWPHSSYMVPGGIVSIPSPGDILQARLLLKQYRNWYERRVLGCTVERWREIDSEAALESWLQEAPEHADGDVGFFLRFCHEAGIDKMGRGHDNWISYGALELPEGTSVVGLGRGDRLVPAGFASGTEVTTFLQTRIEEHVAASWFVDYEGGKHPFDGETNPYASGREGDKYSWAKAPRYGGLPAETGPLGEFVIARDPLFSDLVGRHGGNAMIRELARFVRGAAILEALETWLSELGPKTHYYEPHAPIEEGRACGLTQASRGALGHWVKIEKGTISHYQVITPTGWNGSPRDADGVRGPLEESLIGTPVPDPDNPIFVGHVLRSFDPCLVCTVHALENGKRHRAVRFGGFA